MRSRDTYREWAQKGSINNNIELSRTVGRTGQKESTETWWNDSPFDRAVTRFLATAVVTKSGLWVYDPGMSQLDRHVVRYCIANPLPNPNPNTEGQS